MDWSLNDEGEEKSYFRSDRRGYKKVPRPIMTRTFCNGKRAAQHGWLEPLPCRQSNRIMTNQSRTQQQIMRVLQHRWRTTMEMKYIAFEKTSAAIECGPPWYSVSESRPWMMIHSIRKELVKKIHRSRNWDYRSLSDRGNSFRNKFFLHLLSLPTLPSCESIHLHAYPSIPICAEINMM